jgi:hypothetical protein
MLRRTLSHYKVLDCRGRLGIVYRAVESDRELALGPEQ